MHIIKTHCSYIWNWLLYTWCICMHNSVLYIFTARKFSQLWQYTAIHTSLIAFIQNFYSVFHLAVAHALTFTAAFILWKETCYEHLCRKCRIQQRHMKGGTLNRETDNIPVDLQGYQGRQRILRNIACVWGAMAPHWTLTPALLCFWSCKIWSDYKKKKTVKVLCCFFSVLRFTCTGDSKLGGTLLPSVMASCCTFV